MELGMLEFAATYGYDVYSQNGEDGILAEALARLFFQVNKGRSVEIGGNDGFYCSNTALLVARRGWSGLFVESNEELCRQSVEAWKPLMVLASHLHLKVDGENVNTFVDDRCDLLSTDTDGADYEIFKGLKAKPKVVVIEIDSSLDPLTDAFNKDGGANYSAMVKLGQSKGYFVLCHVGNIIFVDEQYRELFPELGNRDPLLNVDLYFDRSWQ